MADQQDRRLCNIAQTSVRITSNKTDAEPFRGAYPYIDAPMLDLRTLEMAEPGKIDPRIHSA